MSSINSKNAMLRPVSAADDTIPDDGLPAIQRYEFPDGTSAWLTQRDYQEIEQSLAQDAHRKSIVGHLITFLKRVGLEVVAVPTLAAVLVVGIAGGVLAMSEADGGTSTGHGQGVTLIHGATPPSTKGTPQLTPGTNPNATATPGKTPPPTPTKTPPKPPTPTPTITPTPPPVSGNMVYVQQYTQLLTNYNDPSSVAGDAKVGTALPAICSATSTTGAKYDRVVVNGQDEYIPDNTVSGVQDGFAPTKLSSC